MKYHNYSDDDEMYDDEMYDDRRMYDDDDDTYDRETYDDYNGYYVQDNEGWSDQDINDALDGEPDAYWNID